MNSPSTHLIFASSFYLLTRPRPVFLLDYSCYRPRDDHSLPLLSFVDRLRLAGSYDDSSVHFQKKILDKSGLGDRTHLPEAILMIPPSPTMKAAREETEQAIFAAFDSLLAITKINPKDIGILVVNSSLFNPTPSLSAVIVNKYKLRGNIKTFNLGGMGCSAGVILVDLAKDMLQLHRSTYAVVVSTENITQNSYHGVKKSMLIANCLFRVGGAAILLSNTRRRTRRGRRGFRCRKI
ncbi:hypothetical protein SASPL_134028 [Salvia splendens]|uniref:FAE domain-containing protein n=1 Tax=Salvia splendens TaxID=180675 RepID=A0A8X8X667_SALSN|nr:hypothetical protein SASPL_134028 [Salvia splendens]